MTERLCHGLVDRDNAGPVVAGSVASASTAICATSPRMMLAGEVTRNGDDKLHLATLQQLIRFRLACRQMDGRKIAGVARSPGSWRARWTTDPTTRIAVGSAFGSLLMAKPKSTSCMIGTPNIMAKVSRSRLSCSASLTIMAQSLARNSMSGCQRVVLRLPHQVNEDILQRRRLAFSTQCRCCGRGLWRGRARPHRYCRREGS